MDKQCSRCGKQFGRRDNLKRHILNKHSTDQMKKSMTTKCVKCGKYFSRKDVLKRHQAIHYRSTVNTTAAAGYRNGTDNHDNESDEVGRNENLNTTSITKQMEQLDIEIRCILQRNDLSEYNKVLECRDILKQFHILY